MPCVSHRGCTAPCLLLASVGVKMRVRQRADRVIEAIRRSASVRVLPLCRSRRSEAMQKGQLLGPVGGGVMWSWSCTR